MRDRQCTPVGARNRDVTGDAASGYSLMRSAHSSRCFKVRGAGVKHEPVRVAVLAVAVSLLAFACGGDTSQQAVVPASVPTGSDAEVVASVGGDAEAGSDAEVVASTGSDAEAGSDADAEAGSDAEVASVGTDAEAGSDAEVVSVGTDAEAGSDAEVVSVGSDAEAEAGSDAEAAAEAPTPAPARLKRTQPIPPPLLLPRLLPSRSLRSAAVFRSPRRVRSSWSLRLPMSSPPTRWTWPGKTVLFTPDGQSGYSRSVHSLAWEEDIGLRR